MTEHVWLFRLLYRERLRAQRSLVPPSLRTPPEKMGAWLGRQSTTLAWKIGEWWAKPKRPSSIGVLKVSWIDLYWRPTQPSNGVVHQRPPFQQYQ